VVSERHWCLRSVGSNRVGLGLGWLSLIIFLIIFLALIPSLWRGRHEATSCPRTRCHPNRYGGAPEGVGGWTKEPNPRGRTPSRRWLQPIDPGWAGHTRGVWRDYWVFSRHRRRLPHPQDLVRAGLSLGLPEGSGHLGLAPSIRRTPTDRFPYRKKPEALTGFEPATPWESGMALWPLPQWATSAYMHPRGING